MPDTNKQELKDALIKKADEIAHQQATQVKRRDDFMRRAQHKMKIELLKIQAACSHRKGATFSLMIPDINSPDFLKFEPKLPAFKFDFCVLMHTFVNNVTIIKCMMCKREWHTGDPDFEEARQMVLASSNRPSSSEVLINGPAPATPSNLTTYAYPIKLGFWKRFWRALTTPNERKVIKDVIEEFKGDDA